MRHREIPRAESVRAIREFGRGEGRKWPQGRRPRSRVAFLDRRFRRHFKGLVGS